MEMDNFLQKLQNDIKCPYLFNYFDEKKKNPYEWKTVLVGPYGSIYENGFYLLKIVFHKSFTIIIDLLIIINSIFLVFETIKRFLNLSQILNTLFTLIFTIEGLLKIISFGFILDENSYLRDPWNWIDFFVIITGLISIIPGIYTNWTALRVFRLLRTIKTIKLFPNVRRFVNVVLNSLIDLTAVFFMLFFFLFSFLCFRFKFME